MLWTSLAAALLTQAGDTITYRVSLPAPQTQMVEMSMVVPANDVETLDLHLPVWRPGRYVVLDHAGTLREMMAEDQDGRPLEVRKRRKSHWKVETDGAETVRISWRIYANSLRDRTRHVDDSHAFLSPSSSFLYSEAHRDARIRVELDLPDGWDIACGMAFENGSDTVLVADDYDVLVDSPIEVGLHDRIEFDAGGVPHEIVVWPRGTASDERMAEMAEDFATIVEEQLEVFGRLPFDRYVFLMHVGAGAGGGTEHINSTIMQTSRAAMEDDTRYERFLGLVAHEYFHVWNVKQLRPAGLTPYDYQGENYTDLLWVAEGTTDYYDSLTLARTGHTKQKKYLERLGDSITSLRNRPGAAVQSLSASSYDAWIKFNKSTPDDVNSTVSFYSKGALVSFLLDLDIRRRSNGAATLDDVMREMFIRYPLAGGGYTTANLIEVVEELAGGEFDAFFDAYVSGTARLPFEEMLGVVGLDLVFEYADEDDPSDAPYIGLDLSSGSGGPTVRAVRADGPAYRAGLIAGDEIVALEGRRLSAGALDERLEQIGIGQTATFHIMRRDELRTIAVTIDGRPDGEWVIERLEEPTDEQRAAYESWIGKKWPGKADEEPDDD